MLEGPGRLICHDKKAAVAEDDEVDVGIIPAYAGSTTSRAGRWIWIGDHPRICGEHHDVRCGSCGARGSSPHMRGARPAARHRLRQVGIIPAYAGSTRRPYSAGASHWDHPRICGEHQLRLLHRLRDGGIIPAYAGSTGACRTSCTAARDHPRICGEHSSGWYAASMWSGSSPHMRGAPLRELARQQLAGIIPAYAGSTGFQAGFAGPSWDHPRICGEHIAADVRKLAQTGSSPHMRGAQRVGGLRELARGIIPAYAGSTRARATRRGRWRDHPRICGEHLAVEGREGEQRGIIPAYAGSTARTAESAARGWDHPRICGEHLEGATAAPSSSGSSPHMRGAQATLRIIVAGLGIIPAYAGSTAAFSASRLASRDHPRICGEHWPPRPWPSCETGSSPHMRGAPQVKSSYGFG